MYLYDVKYDTNTKSTFPVERESLFYVKLIWISHLSIPKILTFFLYESKRSCASKIVPILTKFAQQQSLLKGHF